jgi:hypothetical protein
VKKEKLFIKTQVENKELKHDNIEVFFGLILEQKLKKLRALEISK